jgi:hypothetical protein
MYVGLWELRDCPARAEVTLIHLTCCCNVTDVGLQRSSSPLSHAHSLSTMSRRCVRAAPHHTPAHRVHCHGWRLQDVSGWMHTVAHNAATG